MLFIKKENKKEKITILVIVIIVILAIVGVYLFFANKKISSVYSIDKIDVSQLIESEVELLNSIKTKIVKNQLTDQDLINLAVIQKHSGNFNEGIEILLEAYKMNSDNVLIMNNLGDLYTANKDYLKAEEWLLKAVTISPTWINGYENLYSIYKYHLTEKLSSYPELVERGIEYDVLGTNTADMYILLGNYYLEQMNNKKALEWYKKAYDLRPANELLKGKIEKLK